MAQETILVLHWLPDGVLGQLAQRFPAYNWVDGRDGPAFEQHRTTTAITYGLPPLARLAELTSLRWIQLASAGVPQDLCPAAQARNLTVTNLAGLYGPTIAEHALTFLSTLGRHLHTALRNQQKSVWDSSVNRGMMDLRGHTLAIVGLGNIGQNIARLAKAYGMRVVGCRRTGALTPFVDQVYSTSALCPMLAEADFVGVAAPLTKATTGMLGPNEFAAMKTGVIYANVSRGPIAQEPALLEALRAGRVKAAGLDVFAVEPLPADHPLWTMPQVLISPHYCGDTVNLSGEPSARFGRNLAAWTSGRPLEGIVDLAQGY